MLAVWWKWFSCTGPHTPPPAVLSLCHIPVIVVYYDHMVTRLVAAGSSDNGGLGAVGIADRSGGGG